MERTLLDGALVVTMDPGRRIIEDGAVLIEGDTIVAVGKSARIASEFTWDLRIDARDKVVTPGFIDTHIHLSEHIVRSLIPDDAADWMRGWLLPIYASLTPEDEYFSALLACVEMLRTGTTTFCEAGTCFHIDRVAEAVAKAGIRAVLGRWSWDLPREPVSMGRRTDEALRENLEMLDFVEGLENPLIQARPLLLGMGTASDELLTGAKRLATDHGVGMGFMHASNIPSLETEHAIPPLAHFERLGLLDRDLKLTHMVYLDDTDLRLVKEHGVKVTHCPSAAMKHSKGISRHGLFPEMAAGGVCVSIGADSANSSDHSNMLRLMHMVAHVFKDFRMSQAVFPAEKVLEMATVDGARALGMEAQVGSIEVGKQADLVVFDRNHPEWRPLLDVPGSLVYAVTDRSIEGVFVAGRQVVKGGAVVGVDEVALYGRIETLSRRLIERAGITPVHRWPVL